MISDKIAVLPLALGRSEETLPYLSVGMVTAYLRQYRDGALAARYDIDRLLVAGYPGHPLNAVYKRVRETDRPVCLLSSYVWNHQLNLEAAERIREISPGALNIIGGPHVPKYEGETESFLRDHPFIDIAVLGEGEAACAEILLALADSASRDLGKLHTVTGIVFSNQAAIVRTASRARIRDIRELPSPYLTGEFEPWFEHFPVTVLETNRGCPYGCTYCDWGSATLERVTKFTPDRVIAEIEYIAQKKSQSIFIADANFGMLEQDIEIARALVEVKARLGYPVRVYTNFAKNGGRRLMAVIKILNEGGLLPTGIIALQTIDPKVLKTIARDNIRTSSYEKMMEYFNAENIPIASDLMIGLPGQTVDSFANDLQFCFDWKVSAQGNYTSMMPNAPMAEHSYRQEHLIVTDDNNMVQSTRSFSAEDMVYMKHLYTTYQFHVRLGILKYILYYLQIEHEIRAIDFLRRWLDAVLTSDPELLLSGRVFREIFATGSRHRDWATIGWEDSADFLFSNIEAYYDELLRFSMRCYDVELDPSVYRSLIAAQQAVVPRIGRQYPYDVSLEHDVRAYVDQIRAMPTIMNSRGSLLPLAEFPSGKLSVTPEFEAIDSISYETTEGHTDEWELPSPLRFY